MEESQFPPGPAGLAWAHGAEVSWPASGADGLRARKGSEPGVRRAQHPSGLIAKGNVSVSLAPSLLVTHPKFLGCYLPSLLWLRIVFDPKVKSGASLVVQTVKNLPAMRATQV